MSIAARNDAPSKTPITLRARTDLIVSTTYFQDEKTWVFKDPISLKYFQLKEAEYEVFQLLDGKHSYAEIKRSLLSRFPTRKYEIAQLHQLVHSLHGNGLLLNTASGQTDQLVEKRKKIQSQKRLQLMSSIVSIRFPGFDPERILAWLYPKVSWLFSKAATVFFCCVIAAALLLIGSNSTEFRNKLPQFQQFFGLNNLLYMGFVLVVTKSLHEFGHGLACKHFKGECHEMGFMLMVLSPAMYCDTSDSWILPNKWHRIAIGAAGMWVEVVLAAGCTFVWWYTQPGWLHYLALNIMFLSSVATIVFNINPLLRYDGYYMLSDYLEIPNLSQKANAVLIDRLRVWCLGMEPSASGQLPSKQQVSFVIYSVSSFFYRWFVLLMIFWFLTRVFAPYGLELIGYAAIAMSLAGSVAVPLYKTVKFFLYPGRARQMNRGNMLLTGLLLALVAGAVCFVPLPHHVLCDFVVRPADAEKVFVAWPGTLTEINASYGDRVESGQLLARLRDPELDLTLEKLQSELDRQRILLETYRASDGDALESARLAAEASIRIGQLEKQLAERNKQRAQLELRASRDGFVIPPPNEREEPVSPSAMSATKLATWSKTPLLKENLTATLDRETLVCYVGEPDKLTAMLAVPQDDLRFLQMGQMAQLSLKAYRGERCTGEVAHVATKPMESLPRELSATNGGPIAPSTSGSNEAPMLTFYDAAVALNDSTSRVLPGMIGKAKIRVGSSTLASRAYRSLVTVFRFR